MEKQSTPPPKELTTPDTIPKPKQTSLAGYRSGDLALGRTTVLRDLGDIPSVSLDYFKSAALPPLHEQIDVGKIKESLQRDADVWSQASNQWAGFAKEPKDSELSEDMTFKPLSNVFDAVVRGAATAANTQAKLRFVSRPSESPLSERSNATRPDAYLLLVKKKSIDAQVNKDHVKDSNINSWDDIVVSLEFKKGNGNVERKDDDKKIVWSLHHIMRSDPCRRATFGVTLENTITLVSKSFNFLSEPEHLIYFFCSLAFAYDHELGWDPTIQRVCIKGKTQYDITVRTDEGENLVYQTTRIISDFNADALRGRGTRIFEVCLKSEDGKPVDDAKPAVLKDCWRDSDRDREDTILEQIFTDLQNQKGIEQADEARKYFLTVLAAGNVIVDGKIDGTDSLLRVSDLPTDCTWYPLPADEALKAKPTRAGEGLTPSFPCVSGSAKQPQVHHRIHSRLVFEEVCQPIYELRRLDTVFETPRDAHKALQFLHSVGWVHRDVSAGNVLRAGQMGKLADLEYAKHMNSKTTHEVRTGTLEFMACEVEAQKYLFGEHDLIIPYGTTFNPPFRFNPLHDMESIWWIPTWVLYYHVDQDGSQVSTSQLAWFNDLFPGRLNSRFSTFSARMVYQVLPTPFHRAAHEIEIMHQKLIKAYTNSEKEMPPAKEPAYTEPLENLHSSFTQYFTSAVEYSRGVSLFRPMVKRLHQEDPLLETRDNKQPKV
ncbi:hypothetical protein EDC04DRAFT_2916514 [Pisolithus marmoratus]|nr:hypothetical protein EDC04DRAFT_2916514 [Pisolithus marmoratus]